LYAGDLIEINSPNVNYGFTCSIDFEKLEEASAIFRNHLSLGVDDVK